ncbi:hypothetical protein HK098_000107 [Nowakowskiella sp. JEL0407]|nr:hypothetical protein HK098_000107 [Nowakowskiella sp. JEL0407]
METSKVVYDYFVSDLSLDGNRSVHVEITPYVGLRERFFGTYEGKPNTFYEEIWSFDPLEVPKDGVEAADSVLDRALKVLHIEEEKNDANDNSDCETVVLVVSHGDTLQILQSYFNGISPWVHRSEVPPVPPVPQVPIDTVVAETWQPEHYHMMRADARLDQKRRFHAVEESVYPLPADIQEQDRLELQHLLYRYAFNELFHMPLHDRMKKEEVLLLDIGCGPGSWMRDVAESFPLAQLYGVDMAQSLFEGVEVLPNMQFFTGDVMGRLPFEDNTFDGVFQRLLIFALPKDKWDYVMNELVRVLKPGGYLELVEPDPLPLQMGPNYSKLCNSLNEAMSNRGLHIKIAYELAPKALATGKLKLVRETACSFPIGWGGQVGQLHLLNTQQSTQSLKPFLSKSFGMTSEEYDKLVTDAMAECAVTQPYYNAYSVVLQKL